MREAMAAACFIPCVIAAVVVLCALIVGGRADEDMGEP